MPLQTLLLCVWPSWKSSLYSVCVHSWNRPPPYVESPVTPATCPSSVPAPTLTAQPTSTCMTGTPARALRATATTASARLMSSNASPCGDQVNQWLPTSWSVHIVFTCRGEILHLAACILYLADFLILRVGAKPAPGICFERVNSAGDPYGNCGKDSKGSFAKCDARWDCAAGNNWLA